MSRSPSFGLYSSTTRRYTTVLKMSVLRATLLLAYAPALALATACAAADICSGLSSASDYSGTTVYGEVCVDSSNEYLSAYDSFGCDFLGGTYLTGATCDEMATYVGNTQFAFCSVIETMAWADSSYTSCCGGSSLEDDVVAAAGLGLGILLAIIIGVILATVGGIIGCVCCCEQQKSCCFAEPNKATPEA